jgi:membrane-associated protease RseP (regulator of RpoE activity)
VPNEAKLSAPHATLFATTEADGSFTFDGVDTIPYSLVADLDDYARTVKDAVPGGTQNVQITLDKGLSVSGLVIDPDDRPIPAFTLLVTQREGVLRHGVAVRTVIDPAGKFSVRVPKGDYELLVYASGWAPSGPVPAAAGSSDTKIKLSQGAVLAGKVIDAKSREPLAYARVQREGGGGGASAQPANAGTVTRADGTFELAGIPPGPFTISIGAGNHHSKLEGGLLATEGGTVGPIEVQLQPLAEGESPQLELVGIGVKLAAAGDTIRVDQVVPNGGAAAAGIVDGEVIVAIDGIPVTTLGLDGTVARIRGVAGTKLSVTVLRDGKPVQLVVERKSLKYG